MKKHHLIFSLVLTAIIFVSFSNPFIEKTNIVEVEGLNDSINYNFVSSDQLYAERWNVLPQPNFWRTLMQMGNDSALINIASTRQIIKKVAVKDWDKQSDAQKDFFRDSLKTHYNLGSDAKIFMTSGKRDFYDFKKVIPSIGRGIEIFKENNVDPFYAQAILLIESPNKLQKSEVGAYGSFQIMKTVAINLGLKVNKTIDEREDFDKSAWGAAKLIRTICIPELNKILDARCIEYQPTDTWYRLLVLHVYHAGAGNVKHAINAIDPEKGDLDLITTLWQTEAAGFRNASQNYSQLALASMLELDDIIYRNCNNIVTYN
jgi:hypothetical protein